MSTPTNEVLAQPVTRDWASNDSDTQASETDGASGIGAGLLSRIVGAALRHPIAQVVAGFVVTVAMLGGAWWTVAQTAQAFDPDGAVPAGFTGLGIAVAAFGGLTWWGTRCGREFTWKAAAWPTMLAAAIIGGVALPAYAGWL